MFIPMFVQTSCIRHAQIMPADSHITYKFSGILLSLLIFRYLWA